jgi:hypothetical protein
MDARITSAKDLLGLMREACIVLLFVLVLATPEWFGSLVQRSGITKVSAFGVEWEKQIKVSSDQAKDAGEAIAKIEDRVKDLGERLTKVRERSTEPGVRAQLALLVVDVGRLITDTQDADRATKKSLKTQQHVIAQVSPTTAETTGWMYLGMATGSAQAWKDGRPRKIDPVALSALKPGTRVRTKEDVYLRADTGKDAGNLPRVTSVLPGGEQVEILTVDYHARADGLAVWAKVKRT